MCSYRAKCLGSVSRAHCIVFYRGRQGGCWTHFTNMYVHMYTTMRSPLIYTCTCIAKLAACKLKDGVEMVRKPYSFIPSIRPQSQGRSGVCSTAETATHPLGGFLEHVNHTARSMSIVMVRILLDAVVVVHPLKKPWRGYCELRQTCVSPRAHNVQSCGTKFQ